jgi:hypothetical protein
VALARVDAGIDLLPLIGAGAEFVSGRGDRKPAATGAAFGNRCRIEVESRDTGRAPSSLIDFQAIDPSVPSLDHPWIGPLDRSASDCGYGTWVGQAAVDPDVVWAKFAAMAEGARIATKQFWK